MNELLNRKDVDDRDAVGFEQCGFRFPPTEWPIRYTLERSEEELEADEFVQLISQFAKEEES